MTDRPSTQNSDLLSPKFERSTINSPATAAEVAGRLWKLVDRELWVVTGAHSGTRGGLLATTVSSVSIVPTQPRAVVALAKTHQTTTLVVASGAFALHLLGSHQSQLAQTFGLCSGRDVDKFANWPAEPGVTGAPVLSAAVAWMECRIESCVDIGDRWLIVGSIQASGERRESEHDVEKARRETSAEAFTPLTLHQWLPQLDSTTRDRLKSQLVSDGQHDARAIESWRQCGGESGNL